MVPAVTLDLDQANFAGAGVEAGDVVADILGGGILYTRIPTQSIPGMKHCRIPLACQAVAIRSTGLHHSSKPNDRDKLNRLFGSYGQPA